MIDEKFADDEHLREVLISELEKVESPEAGENQMISEEVLMTALRAIMKNQIQAINTQREDNDIIIEELQ